MRNKNHKNMNDTFPIQVLVSKGGNLEFPSDWTKDKADSNVVIVNNFTTMMTANNQKELTELYEGLSYSVFDYCTDSAENTLIFTSQEALDKFKKYIRTPKCSYRLVTESDKAKYEL